MRRIKQTEKKLKCQTGESIAETLIALLISSLALVILASMITSTNSIVSQSKEYMDKYYEAVNCLSSYTESVELDVEPSDGSVVISNPDGEVLLSSSVSVYTYDGRTPIVSYYVNHD